MALIIAPLSGDRAAYDTLGFPALHSSDIEAGTPIHHVPEGTAVGDKLVWDGSKWSIDTSAASIMTLGTFEGPLDAVASPMRIHNLYGQARTITKVFLSVNVAPTGDDVIVDVYVDGISVFLTANRPKVLDGQTTGYSVTFDSDAWDQDSILTWEVIQIGSSTPGESLVVHIVHGPG